MGKAKRFDSHTESVNNERSIAQLYGQARQNLSRVGSSFRNTPLGASISYVTSDNLGDHTATKNLNMSTYNIEGLDTLYFNASGTNDATIDASTVGISHNVATGDVHTFQVNASTKLQIGSLVNFYADIESDSGATFLGSVTINGATALGNASTDAIFTYGSFWTSLIPDTDNNVDLGSATKEWRNLYVDGISYLDTISAGATTTITLFTTSTTSLGDAATDQINFYGMTDWKNNTTTSNASTGNREGYITIKINGTDKKLYYYA